jgi:shikimate dehydrogenase
MNIKGSTRVVGIFGHPVGHSLSPAMHNAAFAALGLDYVYVPFPVTPREVQSAVPAIRALGLAGVNVTVPHKEAVIPLIDRLDPLARRIGSVNTIVNRGGVLRGYNTDAEGFLMDLRAQGFSPRGTTTLLLGAGGAARAVAHALKTSGARQILIAARHPVRARRLAQGIPGCAVVPARDLRRQAAAAQLLVNATPLGMGPNDPAPIDPQFLRRDLFVYDLVYNRDTRLLRSARRVGATAAGGLGMLVQQGALAFKLWTGTAVPLAVMQQAVRAQLHIS